MESDGEDPPVLMIRGERVALGPWHRAMIPHLLRWNNDLTVSLFAGEAPRPVSEERVEALYEQCSKNESEDAACFLIYESATLRPIGWSSLTEVDHAHRVADYHIVIGEQDCWGKGYGTEATILVLDYAFNVLGLSNVMLAVLSYNERAIRTYTRAGFAVIGRRRGSHRIGEHVYDDVLMDCVSTDFHSPLPPVLDLP